MRDLPPVAEPGLEVRRSAVYYGENLSGYRLVATAIPELDYPRGDENVYTSYRGSGGIALDRLWKRLLFAWYETDANILISAYATPDTRIQISRGIEERVKRLAPFLVLDGDPYPVLSEGGIHWIVDAYTVAESFPYSEPGADGLNYIRNSVKVVVDAYEGSVELYVVDPRDPVAGVYRRAFPHLFSPIDAMPGDLRRHLRYPQDLFEIQVQVYNAYHMTVPQVYYNREDLWAAPREKYGGEIIPLEPYYVLMKLPREHELQFLLMTPLTPHNRDNMIAWMAARSDYPDYGKLLVYMLPKDHLILGPIQVEATIDQDTAISRQLSLWDQRGSRVIRGNLLVIPIEHSFIYVEPVYLIAEDADIPQLKRIIVSDGTRLAMEPTLEAALAAVYGAPARGGSAEGAPANGVESARLAAARQALQAAEAALRAADWAAFGRAMKALKEALAP